MTVLLKILDWVSSRIETAQAALPLPDWTLEDVRETVLAWIGLRLMANYDRAEERWIAAGKEDGYEDDEDPLPLPYGLIEETFDGVRKAWIWDTSGRQEITTTEFDERLKSRGPWGIWPYQLYQYTVRKDLRQVSFCHGDAPLGLRWHQEIVVQRDDRLELEDDPHGFFMMN